MRTQNDTTANLGAMFAVVAIVAALWGATATEGRSLVGPYILGSLASVLLLAAVFSYVLEATVGHIERAAKPDEPDE